MLRVLERDIVVIERPRILVAYLGPADNVSVPLLIRLREVNQPVIRTQNRFSTLRPRLLACI
jgi:hypothetical protein